MCEKCQYYIAIKVSLKSLCIFSTKITLKSIIFAARNVLERGNQKIALHTGLILQQREAQIDYVTRISTRRRVTQS